MSMIRVEPVQVRVRTGWLDGSPREITWGAERLRVTRLTAVREEAAAFPVITGPRTLFEVETPRARLVGSRLPAPFERDPMTAPEARSPRQASEVEEDAAPVDADSWPDGAS